MDVQLLRGALLWESGLSVDADGCPRAYAPPGSGLHGLDDLSCAGRPGHWWGLVVNAAGDPVVQGAGDPAPGFYISPTALGDHRHGERDPARYVDAAIVPYISIPPELEQRGVHMGDVGMAIYRGRPIAAIVADVGPRNKIGEASIALAAALGLPSSPRNGGCSWGVTWLIWPGSRATPAWRRAVGDFQAQSVELFRAWGGLAGVPWMAPTV